MEPAPKVELHLLELAAKPLGYRLSLDGEAPSLACGCTDVGKTEKVKSLRLTLALPFAAGCSKLSELNEPCFLRVQAKAQSAHPPFNIPEKPLGLRLVLKPHDKVIAVSNDDNIASYDSPSPLTYPQVKNIMQVHIGEQGRDYGLLRGSHFRFRPDAFLNDSCAKPFFGSVAEVSGRQFGAQETP